MRRRLIQAPSLPVSRLITLDCLSRNAALAAKLQAAMGGPPMGPGGQPSQQQMMAIQVRPVHPRPRHSKSLPAQLIMVALGMSCAPPQRALPPDMLRKMRAAGPAGASKLLSDLMNGRGDGSTPAPAAPAGGGMPGMGDLMKMMGGMMGGGGGGGGLPGMAGGMPSMADMQSQSNSTHLRAPDDELTLGCLPCPSSEAMSMMGGGGAGGGGGMPGQSRRLALTTLDASADVPHSWAGSADMSALMKMMGGGR